MEVRLVDTDQPAIRASTKTTAITVAAGKPSELAFELSKTTASPAGTVVFKVTDRVVVPAPLMSTIQQRGVFLGREATAAAPLAALQPNGESPGEAK